MLTRDQTEIGHELAGIIEPPHVADLRDHARCDYERDTAERLQRFNYGTEGPFGQKRNNFSFDSHFLSLA